MCSLTFVSKSQVCPIYHESREIASAHTEFKGIDFGRESGEIGLAHKPFNRSSVSQFVIQSNSTRFVFELREFTLIASRGKPDH